MFPQLAFPCIDCFIFVCMYVCVCVCMYVCMYASIYQSTIYLSNAPKYVLSMVQAEEAETFQVEHDFTCMYPSTNRTDTESL